MKQYIFRLRIIEFSFFRYNIAPTRPIIPRYLLTDDKVVELITNQPIQERRTNKFSSRDISQTRSQLTGSCYSV